MSFGLIFALLFFSSLVILAFYNSIKIRKIKKTYEGVYQREVPFGDLMNMYAFLRIREKTSVNSTMLYHFLRWYKNNMIKLDLDPGGRTGKSLLTLINIKELNQRRPPNYKMNESEFLLYNYFYDEFGDRSYEIREVKDFFSKVRRGNSVGGDYVSFVDYWCHNVYRINLIDLSEQGCLQKIDKKLYFMPKEIKGRTSELERMMYAFENYLRELSTFPKPLTLDELDELFIQSSLMGLEDITLKEILKVEPNYHNLSVFSLDVIRTLKSISYLNSNQPLFSNQTSL